VLKEFFAEQEDDEFINHLIAKFARYYQPMTARRVYMYYDVNGNTHVANSNETYAQLARRLLEEQGFKVQLMSHGANPYHDDRYEFINLSLSELDRRAPKIRVNEANCPNLKIAMYNAPVKIGEKGRRQKHKGSEKNTSKTPPKQATHITDAFDYIFFSKFRDNVEERIETPMMLLS
jgi:hypothetical protein